MRCLLKCLVFALVESLVLRGQIYPQTIVLNRDSYKHYIDSFNANDQELYPQFISNRQCWSFLPENIPFLDCPDKIMEQTYYFRWWTYRKHIRKTPAGLVIPEFLPDVPWAGKYNTINCAAALHVYEGRWLPNPNGSWSAEKGGVERGKDDNHSTYCDLIISGLIGIRPQWGNQLIINPLLPANTRDYFCLDRVAYHGHWLTVPYDKTGRKYKKAAAYPALQRISLTLNQPA